MRVVAAPIESVEVVAATSYPAQYFAHVVSGLPSGCAKFYRYEVARSGERITITVSNTLPSAPVPCTQVYGYVDHNIALGSDFIAGGTYTVQVNDVTRTFVAH